MGRAVRCREPRAKGHTSIYYGRRLLRACAKHAEVGLLCRDGPRDTRSANQAHQRARSHGRRRGRRDSGHVDARVLHRQRQARIRAGAFPDHRSTPVRGARSIHRVSGAPQGQSGAATRLLDELIPTRAVPGHYREGRTLPAERHEISAPALAAPGQAHRSEGCGWP